MTDYRFDIRRPALSDLADQFNWLEHEAGVDAAERFLLNAEGEFSKLAETPGLGTLLDIDSAKLRSIRKWRVPTFPNHLIFYLPRPGGISIVRVLHGARDCLTLLQVG